METNVCVAEEVGTTNSVSLFQTCNVLYHVYPLICSTLGEEETEMNFDTSHILKSEIAFCMHAGKSNLHLGTVSSNRWLYVHC